MPCQYQGVVAWNYTLQDSSPKRTFLQGLQPAGRAVVPFSWCWLVCLCHVVKTTKMADTFQTETNILHHYKGILLLKLLWHNQNYQLVLCGSRDWSLVIWLHRLGQWPRSLGINLTDSHPNLVDHQCVRWGAESCTIYVGCTVFELGNRVKYYICETPSVWGGEQSHVLYMWDAQCVRWGAESYGTRSVWDAEQSHVGCPVCEVGSRVMWDPQCVRRGAESYSTCVFLRPLFSFNVPINTSS